MTICKNSQRAKRLREIRRWREYREAIRLSKTESGLSGSIHGLLPGFLELKVHHGWRAFAAIYTDQGRYYAEADQYFEALLHAAKLAYLDWMQHYQAKNKGRAA